MLRLHLRRKVKKRRLVGRSHVRGMWYDPPPQMDVGKERKRKSGGGQANGEPQLKKKKEDAGGKRVSYHIRPNSTVVCPL